MESLYPFLYSGTTDLHAVLDQVRQSTVAKAEEITELRRVVGAQDGGRLMACAADAAARFAAGGRLLAFGNGGSATDAQQLATLFLNPGGDARPLPALGLASDTSVVTALCNDIGVDVMFARQIAAFGRRSDIAVGLSTSGNSENLLRAFDEASRRGHAHHRPRRLRGRQDGRAGQHRLPVRRARRPRCTGSRRRRPPSTTCCGNSPWPRSRPLARRQTGRAVTGRMLVAGVGNIFLGDDGFGVEVASRLADADLPDWVRVADYGISGMHLAYDLADGYETTILVDASPRGGRAGHRVRDGAGRRPSAPAAGPVAGSPLFDAHGMQPDVVFGMLDMLGADAGRVLLVGCEPASTEPGMGLSAPVAAAVDEAVRIVLDLVRRRGRRHRRRSRPWPRRTITTKGLILCASAYPVR